MMILLNTLQQVAKFGYSTISAKNGQEAIKLIDSEFKLLKNTIPSSSNSNVDQVKTSKISLILTEYNLPIMSGLDTARAIRAMSPPISNIPIIVLTSMPMADIQNKCIDAGINDYFSKPLRVYELEKTLIKWRKANSSMENESDLQEIPPTTLSSFNGLEDESERTSQQGLRSSFDRLPVDMFKVLCRGEAYRKRLSDVRFGCDFENMARDSNIEKASEINFGNDENRDLPVDDMQDPNENDSMEAYFQDKLASARQSAKNKRQRVESLG
ncbi:16135_t:CDS:2, partial [Dentiscutata heterogama]